MDNERGLSKKPNLYPSGGEREVSDITTTGLCMKHPLGRWEYANFNYRAGENMNYKSLEKVVTSAFQEALTDHDTDGRNCKFTPVITVTAYTNSGTITLDNRNKATGIRGPSS